MLLKTLLKKSLTVVAALAVSGLILGGGVEIQAQESGISAPEGMPPDIAEMLGEMESAGADVAVAPSDEPLDVDMPSAAATAGNRYLYTTLRVITKSSTRGCGYADWSCMTRLCKSDLRDSTAWRAWAGCWKRSSWICYFECGQRRNAF
jgi:hypothetical protein